MQAKIALDGMTNLSGGSKGSLQPTASFMQMEQARAPPSVMITSFLPSICTPCS